MKGVADAVCGSPGQTAPARLIEIDGFDASTGMVLVAVSGLQESPLIVPLIVTDVDPDAGEKVTLFVVVVVEVVPEANVPPVIVHA